MRDLDQSGRKRLHDGLDKTAELIMLICVGGHAAGDPWWAQWAAGFLSGHEVGHNEVDSYCPALAELHHKCLWELKRRNGVAPATLCEIAVRDEVLQAAMHLTLYNDAALDGRITDHLGYGFGLLPCPKLR